MEGVNGFMVAADDIGYGHFTDYPSNKETVALQLPFKNGKIPDHVVLGTGACRSSSQVQVECDDDEDDAAEAFGEEL